MDTEDKATDTEDVEDATVTPGEDDEMVELSENVLVTVDSEAVVDAEADAVVADEDVVAAGAVEAATDADAMLALATTEEYCCISITAASSNT